MPNRHTELIEYGARCDLKATDACKRFGIRLCQTHEPALEKRCDRCGEQFALVLVDKGLVGTKRQSTPGRIGKRGG